MELQAFSTCLLCRQSHYKEIVSASEIRVERAYLDKLYRSLLYPSLPDYMFKDQIHFMHIYDARLISCIVCGSVYRDPCLTPQSTLESYRDDDYHDDWLEASFEPYCRLFLSDMPRLVHQVGRDARVLEIGSQVGGFQFAAKQYGWDVRGLDIGTKMTQFARSKGLDVYTGTLHDIRFSDDEFDAVFVWSCFEMIPDPWSELLEIHRVLRKGGKLYITIPNGDFIKLVHRFIRQKIAMPIREPVLKLLAYGILLGFSFQAGYSPVGLNYILNQSGFSRISVKNLVYVPVTSAKQASQKVLEEKERYLKIAHILSEAVRYLSLGRRIIGPWIEVRCERF